MGSIVKRIFEVALGAVLVAGMIPGAALADGTSGSAGNNYEDMVDLHGASAGTPQEFSSEANSVNVSTTVTLSGYDPDDEGLRFIGKSVLPGSLNSVDANTYVEVKFAGGSAVGKTDAEKKSVYEVHWYRSKLVNGVENGMQEVTCSTSDNTTMPPRVADFVTSGTYGKTATACDIARHYLINEDGGDGASLSFEDNATYNYYVQITDTGAAAGANNVIDSRNPAQPIKVITGKTFNYGMGPLIYPALSPTPSWRIDGTIDDVLGETTGLVRKWASLAVSQFDTVASQSDAGYQQLVSKVNARGMRIVGTAKDGSGNQTASDTAAWHVTITDTSNSIYESKDAFIGEVLVTLDLNPMLKDLGFVDSSGNGVIPDKLADWKIIQAGGSTSVSFNEATVVFERDASNNLTGKVSFLVTGVGAITAGDLGCFALARDKDPDLDPHFVVTTLIEDASGVGGATNGTGTITPMETDGSHFVGQAPSYDIVAASDSRIQSVELRFDGAIAGTGGSQLTSPFAIAAASGLASYKLTLDSLLTGRPWENDVTIAVAFEKIPDSKEPSHTVTIVGVSGPAGSYDKDSVRVDGRSVTAGGSIELVANTDHELTFVPAVGFKVTSLKEAKTANAAANEWHDYGAVSSHWTGKLVQDLYYTVEFGAAGATDEPLFRVSAQIKDDGGNAGNKVAFSNGSDFTDVKRNGTASLHVTCAQGYELTGAEVFRKMGSTQVSGGSIMNDYSASSRVLDIKNVSCETTVLVTFGKVGSAVDPNNPSSEPDFAGSVDQADRIPVLVKDVRGVNGDKLTGVTSVPPVGVETAYPKGYDQTLVFYYQGADGKNWVINSLEITYNPGTPKAVTQSLGVSGGVNYATLKIDAPMEIVVKLRTPISGDSGAVDKDAVEGNVVTGGAVPKPGAGTDDDGNVIGKGGQMKTVSDGNGGTKEVWEPGGVVVPETLPVVPGTSALVEVIPDNVGPELPWYWGVDEVVIDGVRILPSKSPVNDNALYFDPTTGEGYFKRADGTRGSAFHWNAKEGTVVIDDVSEPHSVQASFERSVDLDVSMDVKTNFGEYETSTNGAWHIGKADENAHIAIAPEKGHKLIEFTVNGEDRLEYMGDGVSDEDWAFLTASRAGSLARIATYGSNDKSQSEGLFQTFAQMLGPNAYTAGSDLVRDGAKTYTFDLQRDYVDSYLKQYEEALGKATSGARDTQLPEKRIRVLAAFDNPQGGQQGPVEPDDPNNPSDDDTFTLTAKVVDGRGWIDRQGDTVATEVVGKGGKHRFQLIPEAGYQVVRVVDNGVEKQWTNNYYVVENVTEDHSIEVTFAMTVAPGDNDGTGRVLRKITAMLRTGDEALPLAIAALGVAFGAAGVAAIVGSKRRRRD